MLFQVFLTVRLLASEQLSLNRSPDPESIGNKTSVSLKLGYIFLRHVCCSN